MMTDGLFQKAVMSTHTSFKNLDVADLDLDDVKASHFPSSLL